MKKLGILLVVMLGAVAVFAASTKKQNSTPKQEKAEIVIVESAEYAAGQEDVRLTGVLGQFLGMEPIVTKMTQLQAMQDEKMADLKFDFLPVYLIKKTKAVREKMADAIAHGGVVETDDYIVLEHQTRTGVYATQEAKPNVMEVFVMSQCPYGVMAENAIIEAKKEGTFPLDKTVKVRYIVNYDPANGFSSLHGPAEWEEDVRQLLIAKYYPAKFWQYLSIRNKDYRSSRWDVAMKAAGINPNKIMKKFDTEGLELLKEEYEYANRYGVGASPTFLWEGKVQLDFGTASAIEGFSFLNPSTSRRGGAAAAPTGSC